LEEKKTKSETVPEMEDVNHGFIPKEILKLIAESKDDRIEIITTATSDPDDMEKLTVKLLKISVTPTLDFSISHKR
jgi:cyanophycinase